MLDVETKHSEPAMAAARDGDRRFTVALCLAFAAVLAVGLVMHEVWRDEARAWLIVLESDSISELLENMRGERHPAAWYLVLMAVAPFTASVTAMQAVHFVIATAVAVVVVRYAPFPRWQKALLVFGYFFLYEYGVISRGYSLGSLALFSACALLPWRRRSYLPFAALLVLLANTSVYGAILAVAFALFLAADAWLDRQAGGSINGRHTLPSLAVLAAGLVTSAQLMRPGVALGLRGVRRIAAGASSPEWEAATALSTPARAYLPLPDFNSGTLWNSSIFIDGTTPALFLAAVLSAALVLAFSVFLARRPAAAVFYVAGTGAMLAFGMAFDVGSTRHYGHHYLLLVAALWAAHHVRRVDLPAGLATVQRRIERPVRGLFLLILAIQIVAAAVVFGTDLRIPFSTSRLTAEYLEQYDPDRVVIVGASHDATTSVLAYMGQPLLHLDAARRGTFVNRLHERSSDQAAGLDSLRALLQGEREVLVVSARPVRTYLTDGAPGLSFEEVQRFDESMDGHERFVIFRARLR